MNEAKAFCRNQNIQQTSCKRLMGEGMREVISEQGWREKEEKERERGVERERG